MKKFQDTLSAGARAGTTLRSWLVGSSALALVTALSPHAQANGATTQAAPNTQAEASLPSAAGEIIVTAQKRQQNINSVPMSITAVTGEQLKLSGVQDVSDLPKVTPGLSFSQSSTGTPLFTLRGVGYNDVAIAARPAVTLYLDEAPIPFEIEATGANLDIQRVEVLKGPQGTLFGNNSTGGAINYVSNKPTNHFEAGATLTYGRFDEADIEGYVSGPITNTLTARVAIEHRGMGDWQKSYTRNDSLGKKNFNNGRIILLWKPVPEFRAQLTVSHWNDTSDMQATQAINISPQIPAYFALTGLQGYPLAPANDRAADWDAGGKFEKNNHFTQATLRLDYDLNSNLTVTSVSNFIKLNIQETEDSDGTDIQDNIFPQYGDSTSYSEEARVSGKWAKLNAVLGGVFSKDITHDNVPTLLKAGTIAYSFVAPPINGPIWTGIDGNVDQNVRSYAIFGNAEYKITPRLTIQGGARYTNTVIDAFACSRDLGDGSSSEALNDFLNVLRAGAGLAPVAAPANGACASIDGTTLEQGPVIGTLREHNVSWRAGLQYEAAPGTLLYANISKGYKGGSFPTLGAVSNSAYTPATQESVVAYEAGFKTRLFDRALQLNGAGFYYNYRDKQVLGTLVDPVLGAIAALVNVPKSRIYGAELQAVATPVHGLNLSVGGSYVNSSVLGDYTEPNAYGTTENFHGSALPFAPKWNLVGDVHYEWALNDHLNAYGNINETYRSVTYSQLGAISLLRIDPYALTDVAAGVEKPGGTWRFYAWGKNIFNKYYWTNSAKLLDTTVRFAGMPATYGVTFEVKFQ